MRLRMSLLPTLLFLACATPVWSQQVKDPADILPANVLASVEVRQPGPLAREIAALFKDSIFGNVPDSLAPLRKEAPVLGRDRSEGMLMAGTFLSPELMREFGRIRGAAVALTGIDRKHGMPEFLVVVLPGESNIPGFMTRMFLSSYSMSSGTAAPGRGIRTETRGRFEPVDTVEGVKVYRMVYRTTEYPAARPGEAPEAPKTTREVRESEPAVAMMPGALLLGTPSVVKDAIERIKGKSETAALSSVKAYQEARRQLGDVAGLFAFGNPARVFPVIEQMVDRRTRQEMEVLKELLNPKAIRSAAASLGLKEGTLSYRVRYNLDPDEKSPLLELLPSKAVATELLHVAPRDALMFAAISNANGGKRWQQMLALADKLSEKTQPDEPAPSRKLAEIEEKLKIKIGPDLVGRIADAAFAVGNLGAFKEAADKPERPFVPPIGVIVRATSEDDAKALIEGVLPKLVAGLSGQEVSEPTKKGIGGQDIYTLPTKGKSPLCYGRQGETIVLGGDPKLVAAWLKNSTEKGDLAEDEKVAAEVKKLDEPVALAVVKPMAFAFFFLMGVPEAAPAASTDASTAPATPVPDRPLPEGPRPPRRQQQKPRLASETNESEAQAGLPKVMEMVAKDNLLVVGLMRKSDHVQVEARVTGLRKLVPSLLNLAVMEYTRSRPPAAPARPDFAPPREKPLAPVDQPRDRPIPRRQAETAPPPEKSPR